MMDSLESIASCDLEFGLYSKLNEKMKEMSNQGQGLCSHSSLVFLESPVDLSRHPIQPVKG